MTFKTAATAIALTFSALTFSQAQPITDFGAASFNVDEGSTDFSHSSGSLSLQISGVAPSGGNLTGFLTNAVTIDDLSQLTLTGSITSENPNSSFTLSLFDSNFAQWDYLGNTSSFGINSTTVELTLDLTSTLIQLTDIAAIQIIFDGATAPNFSMTLESVGTTAIPEPSVPLLVGLSAAGLLLFRRARRAPALAA